MLGAMATQLLHRITVHDIRVIDSDTIEAWFDFDGVVRIKKRLRLAGIEGGEKNEPLGLRAELLLQNWLHNRLNNSVHLAGGMQRTDQHGRLVGDLIFDTGESLVAICLASGAYWRRSRDGQQTRPDRSPETNKPV